jgi:hypothetical protein
MDRTGAATTPVFLWYTGCDANHDQQLAAHDAPAGLAFSYLHFCIFVLNP